MQLPAPAPARRARAVLLACLLAATLAAGVAARVLGSQRPLVPPTTGGTTTSGASGAVALHAALDRGSVLRGGDGLVRVELRLSGQGSGAHALSTLPTDLVVILDRSGSMDGEPILFAKAAVRELFAGLRPEDRFALIGYASDAAIEVPLSLVREDASLSVSKPLSIERALERIVASGGTYMSAGIDLAHEVISASRMPGRAQRVILLSDGHANQGDFSYEGLRARAARAVQGEYVLSAVGVGQDFDETLMSAVADAGTGNFYYLPDARELAGIFAGEFASARETVARGLRVELAPGPGIALVDAAGYPLEHEGARVFFRPGDLFAGQERRIWLTLRAPTDREGALDLGKLGLRWDESDGARRELPPLALPALACVAGEDAYYASFDDEVYRRGSASEAFGGLKERVAKSLRAGDQAGAVAELDAAGAEFKTEQLRALGYVVPQLEQEIELLRESVAAPSAAAPEVQNRLGKQLLEEGRDARRDGAKR